ncbi:MAG: hypothetical protein ACSHWU_07915 [Marinicella sp.]
MLDLTATNKQALSQFDTPMPVNDETSIDIKAWLIELLHHKQWTAEHESFFQAWMKKIDIAKKQFTHYQLDWKLTADKVEISTDLHQLTIVLALNYLQGNCGIQISAEQKLKSTNALFKALDQVGELVYDLEKSVIENQLKSVIRNHQPSSKVTSQPFPRSKDCPKTLPICVLFSEGPIARAYLETIKALGFKVKKIIRLVSSIDLISKKPVGGLLPKSMKINYAANKQYKQMFYWSNHYLKTTADVVGVIQDQVHKQFEYEFKTLNDGVKNIDLNEYSEVVETLFVTGLKDPVLEQNLMSQDDDLFLYTGGGIVPDQLLALKNKRMIHIHPGFLPEIRGADCVLWSQLLTQKLSASAFIMAPGIDVGDIILPCWLPDVALKFPQNIDSRVKYRLIYGFLDPWVRAYVLKQLIYSTHALDNFDVIPQDENEGMTYHFMHETTKQQVFEKFNQVL